MRKPDYPQCKNCGKDNDCDAGIYCFRCAMIKITSGKLPDVSYAEDRSLAAWSRIITREWETDKTMNKHCPNCHLDVAGDKCRDCGYVFPPVWVCSDCGATFSCVGQFKFCPVCKDKQAVLEKEYWDNKRVGLRSITDDIVAKILNGGS